MQCDFTVHKQEYFTSIILLYCDIYNIILVKGDHFKRVILHLSMDLLKSESIKERQSL